MRKEEVYALFKDEIKNDPEHSGYFFDYGLSWDSGEIFAIGKGNFKFLWGLYLNTSPDNLIGLQKILGEFKGAI